MQIAKGRRNTLIVLAVLTAIASITKVFVGLDYDENYITVLGARLLQGDHLFRECWDLYQTTGLTMALILGVFRSITGGYEGAILFCRIFTAVLQLLLGLFTWHSLKKYFRNADFAGLLVANMLPRGTLNLEYGFLSCNYILLSMILLFLISKEWNAWSKSKKWTCLIFSGILFSLGILSYPTMIIATIVLLAYFWMQRDYRVQGIIFIETCVICAAAFCIYVFAYISPSEMWNNIFEGILMDESHGNGNLLESFIESFILTKEKILQAGAIILGAFAMYVIFNRKIEEKLSYVYFIIFLSSLAIIVLNVFAIRPSGVYGLQVRYFLIIIAGVVLVHRLHNRELTYLFYYMGVFMFLGTLVGSNLGIAENGAFLYMSLIAIVLGQGEQTFSQRVSQCGAILSIIVLVVSLILMKGYIVRVNVTKPANILETREQIDFGPFKGIYLYPEDKQIYSIRKEDIDENLNKEDIVLVLSKDPIYNIYGQYRFSSATALTTPVYGKQWVEYYKNRNYVYPTVVLIDKQYFDADELLNQTSFGEFLQEEYDIDSLYEGKGFWILRRR